MSKMLIRLLLAVSVGINLGVVGMTLMRGTEPHLQGPPPGHGHRPGARPDPAQIVDDHLLRMTRHLDLSPKQQNDVRSILEIHTPQLVELRIQTEQSARLLTKAFSASSFDPEIFHQMTAKMNATRTQLDPLSAMMLVAEATILTPQQREKFAQVASSIFAGQQTPTRPGGRPRGGGPPPGHNQRPK